MLDVLKREKFDALVVLKQVGQLLEPCLHDKVKKDLEREVGDYQAPIERRPNLWSVVREQLKCPWLQAPVLLLPQEFQLVRRNAQALHREKVVDVVRQFL